MKKIILTLTILAKLFFFCTAYASEDIRTWDQARIEIRDLTEKFKSHLSEDNKVKLLPRTNEVLSLMLDLDLSSAQKSEQIEVTVALLAAAFEADFASSTTDTVYFDYKKNKKSYLLEIALLPKNSVKLLTEAFKNLEEIEKNPNDF